MGTGQAGGAPCPGWIERRRRRDASSLASRFVSAASPPARGPDRPYPCGRWPCRCARQRMHAGTQPAHACRAMHARALMPPARPGAQQAAARHGPGRRRQSARHATQLFCFGSGAARTFAPPFSSRSVRGCFGAFCGGGLPDHGCICMARLPLRRETTNLAEATLCPYSCKLKPQRFNAAQVG